MAITSEIIGKLGGGGEVKAISVSAPSKTGSTVLTQIDVPPGKTILVAVRGTLSSSADNLSLNTIQAGGATIGGAVANTTIIAGATTLTTSTSISINIGGYSPKSFTGTIYTAEM